MDHPDHAFEARGLVKRYGPVVALDGIDLALDTDGRDPEDLAREVHAAMRASGLL